MTTTLLEKTIISNARQLQSALAAYYPRQRAGATSEDDETEYLSNHHQMTALLILAHQAESGMSEEAVQQLMAIEHEDAAALRGASLIEQVQAAPETRAGNDYVWWLQEENPDGRWESIDQADDDERALALLSRAENYFSGQAYRLWRSDWRPEEAKGDSAQAGAVSGPV